MKLVFAKKNWLTRVPVNRYDYRSYIIKRDEPLLLINNRFGYAYILPLKAFLFGDIPPRIAKWKRDWENFPHCINDPKSEFCKYYTFEEWKKSYSD